MKRPSVQRAALVEPLTLVAALLTVLSSTAASQQGVWKNVTPPVIPDFGRVSLIDASAFDAGKAYVSARLPLLDDFRPHVWRTEDYGETWTREDVYVNTVRESSQRSPEPAFLRWKGMEKEPKRDFFVRSGSGTVKLSPESAGKYAETRCGLEADG